jgi:uncharacterized RDD family membrane protein YckC
MSSQSPDGDPPPDPVRPPPDDPSPDAETARFPVAETPPPETAPPLEPGTAGAPDEPPPAGIVSAAPVGWTAPSDPAPRDAHADGPVVPWSPPVAAVAPTIGAVGEGLVIARVFPRVVAFAVDAILLGLIGVAVSLPLGLYDVDRDPTVALIVSVILVAVDLVYFVGLWTSGLHATVGMRLLQLRILDAATAKTVPLNDALLRWIALTGAVAILGLVPGIDNSVALIGAVWTLILLITTGSDRLRQGLHDKWARTVVVQPAPGGSGLAFATCLVLVVLFGFILPVAGLLLYGDELRDILVQIGNSV